MKRNSSQQYHLHKANSPQRRANEGHKNIGRKSIIVDEVENLLKANLEKQWSPE